MTQVEPLLYSVKETATLLGVSEWTVWGLIRNGRLDSVEVPSGDSRRGPSKRINRKIARAEIDAFIDRNKVKATA